jgi:broad specificity phosphatase PhoE
MERAILARHGESEYSSRLLVSGIPASPVRLTARGRDEAARLGAELVDDRIDLCVVSEFLRTQETADIALAGRDIPRLVIRDLNDPNYGEFEGRALDDYRFWAAGRRSSEEPPGAGESRVAIVSRYARGFRRVLGRPETTVLVVGHSLPIAYVLAAVRGDDPAPIVPLVEHATAYRLAAADLERAVGRLDAWSAAPTW